MDNLTSRDFKIKHEMYTYEYSAIGGPLGRGGWFVFYPDGDVKKCFPFEKQCIEFGAVKL